MAAVAVGGACASPPLAPDANTAPAPAAPPEPAEPRRVTEAEPLWYDLRASFDLERGRIDATVRIESHFPRERFFLHPALEIESIDTEVGPVELERDQLAVTLATPVRSLEITYGGELGAQGTRDSKGRPYLEPDRVRLTEVTLWYPVFYEGSAAFPWPPEPARGQISLPSKPGLHWATSGRADSATEFSFPHPSDFSIVGVTAVPWSVTTLGDTMSLTVLGVADETIAAHVAPIVQSHAGRLGPLRESSVVLVVFPNPDADTPLAFASSSLIVFNAPITARLSQDAPDALSIIAHELGHLWFGAELRAEGPAARWLTEGFAEYFAWRVVGDIHGDDAYQRFVSTARERSGGASARLDALDADDGRVYTLGALAVANLAERVGEERLEQAIREIQRAGRPWSCDALFSELAAAGVPSSSLLAFRREWGV